MRNPVWQVTKGKGPLVAFAIHHGHSVRPEVAARLALDDDARLREKDPHTGGLDYACPYEGHCVAVAF